jgi:hypothetical protein
LFYIDDNAEEGAEWMDASSAVALVHEHLKGSPDDAKAFIIRRAGASRVRSSCSLMRIEKRGGTDAGVVQRENCLVSHEFWEQFEPAGARSLTEWLAGDFERKKVNQWGRTELVRLVGVRFSKKDILSERPKPVIEWLSASAALCMVQERIASGDAAISIATRALAGLVKTRAAHLSADQPGGRRGHPVVKEADNVEVPKAFWWAKGHPALQQNWATGDFSTWIDDTYEWRAFGVEFAKGDVVKMLLPVHVPVPVDSVRVPEPDEVAMTSPSNKEGRRREPAWNDWVAALAIVAANGEVNSTLTQTLLLKLINEQLGKWEIEEMSRSTVQSAVVRVLEAFEKEGIYS